MLIPNQIVKVKWNSRNKKYYSNLGYVFTKVGDEFCLKAEDLMPNSKVEVQVRCDFCGKIVVKKMQTYNQQHHPKHGDCCIDCQPEKNKLVCLDKYGVDHPKKSQEIREKEKEHNREKYGCDYYWLTEEGKNRIKATNLEKYGVEYTLQSPEIRAKGAETLAKNGICPTSSQQLQLRDLLEEIYGKCELNKPLSRALLDCVICVDGQFIDIEYDGWYWHKSR